MDYITHTLFGAALYGAADKKGMNPRARLSLLTAAVGSSVIPDIDVHWAKAGTHYLMTHRGITHSLIMVPVWAALFAGLGYAVFRTRDRKLWFTAIIGVLLHILSDWSNPWGTGLLEPFTSRRYALGFIANKGYVIWGFAAALLPLLLVFRTERRRVHLFRGFWAICGLFALFQFAHSAYVYLDLKSHGYEHVAIRADRTPGRLSYYAQKGQTIVEGRSEVGGLRGVVGSYHVDLVDDNLLRQDPRARELLLFAPFLATQDLGAGIRVFDPRFEGRVGLLEVVIPKPD